MVHWTNLATAPESIMELLACNCSKTCSLPKCTCVINGMKCSLFRRSIVPKVLCSEGPLFRRPVVLKARCSEGSLLRRLVTPREDRNCPYVASPPYLVAPR